MFPNFFVSRNCTLPSPEWWIPIIPSATIFFTGLLLILTVRVYFFIFKWLGKQVWFQSHTYSSKPLFVIHNDNSDFHSTSRNNSFQNKNKNDAFILKQSDIDPNGRNGAQMERRESGNVLEMEPMDSATNPLVINEKLERSKRDECEQGVVLERMVIEREVLERNHHTFSSALNRLSQRIHNTAVDMLFARTRSGTILVCTIL